MMDAKRFADLKDDICANGLREPITLCEGMVLDGRNRAKAVEALRSEGHKIELRTKTFDGDPWAYVWSLNGARRDLVAEQRYLIWKHCHEESEAWQAQRQAIADEANAKRSVAAKEQPRTPDGKRLAEKSGAPTECRRSSEPQTRAKAAASGTDAGSVARGDKLAKDRPDLAAKVRKGEMKPAEAHRQAKRDVVAKKVAALPQGKYLVIYADPPWDYNDKQAVKGEYGTGTGAAAGHYPSMKLSELKAMGVPDIAGKDSVLFLWVTAPLLPEGLELAAAWGFKYKASFVWDKVKHNMGHYNSVRHEFLLVCTKGSCTPQVSKLFDSVQTIERSAKHSEKPEEFRKIIDTLYPNGQRIELFARTEADGWTRYGADVS
jgi:N6-adenosine-specific RNA methylase IME4